MRKLSLLFVALLGSSTLLAQAAEDRHQSYISYDSGGTVVTQSFDQREIDGRLNLPIFSGDEVRTRRGGRTEIRLADGNVVALDATTGVRFHAIYDSYEGAADQTLIELLYGQMIVHRSGENGQALRLDSTSATYVSDDSSLYSVDSDPSGGDRVAVFGGAVEVRTRQGTTRLRTGERVTVGRDGAFVIHALAQSATNDFERWYLRRVDRYAGQSSRYLSDRFTYANADFDSYGSWVYVQDYSSWVWRPRVSIGWRPFFYGQWVSGPTGCLVWVSDEPWGWIPYHYGRWAQSPLYGWIWVPGRAYSPAWVYWSYGPSWVGWAPSGWYDCYRPYYPWLYRHYSPRVEVGFGFWGRIRLGPADLNGWVVIDSNRIVSTRIDRAAMTTDAIRHRLTRDGGTATFSNVPARFNRDELRDPTTAVRSIARRGVGSGTGIEREGSPADMTTFFRRDPDLSTTARENIVRSVVRDRNVASAGGRDVAGVGTDRGGLTDAAARGGDRGAVVTRDRGLGSPSVSRERVVARPSTQRDSSGAVVPSTGSGSTPPAATREQSPPRIDRSRGVVPKTDQSRDSSPQTSESWRGSTVVRRDSAAGATARSRPASRPEGQDAWRGAVLIGREPSRDSGSSTSSSSGTESHDGSVSSGSSRDGWRSTTPVPKRVIDSIGGSRVVTRGGDSGSGSQTTSRTSSGTSSSSSSRSPAVQRPSARPSSSGSVSAARPSSSRPPASSTSSSSRPSSSKPSAKAPSSSKPTSSSSKPNRVERSKPHQS